METLFFDSSALVKRYIAEPGTDRVLALLEGRSRVAVSRLAHVEVVSTVVRRARGGDLAQDHASSVLATLEEELRSRFSVVEVHAPTLTRAVDLVKAHGLRAADAVQLACALAAASGVPRSEFQVVCSDATLSKAAMAEELRALDPTDE